MPRTLTDETARALFAPHLDQNDGELQWVYGIDTLSMSMFLFFLGPILSAMKTRYFLLGVTKRRLLLIRVTRWFKELESRVIGFDEIATAAADDSRDPYRMGTFIAMPGAILSFELKDGSRYRMGCLNDFQGVPGHGANLAAIRQVLTQRRARSATKAAEVR